MEPSLLNPLSAFGRKVFQMEAHTRRRKPYSPTQLKSELEISGFDVVVFAMFLVAFPIAWLSKNHPSTPPSDIIKFTYFFEELMEK